MSLRRIVLLWAFLLPALSFSQGFVGGVSLGLSASQIDGDKMSGYKKPGLIAGVFVLRKLSDNYGFQLGLQYIGKGAQQNIDLDAGIRESRKTHLDYLEAPVLYNYYYKKFKFDCGLSANYLINSSMEINGYEIPEKQYDMNSIDFDLKAGVNYFVSQKLLVNLRFSYSIFPFLKSSSDIGNRWYNNTIEISGNYIF